MSVASQLIRTQTGQAERVHQSSDLMIRPRHLLVAQTVSERRACDSLLAWQHNLKHSFSGPRDPRTQAGNKAESIHSLSRAIAARRAGELPRSVAVLTVQEHGAVVGRERVDALEKLHLRMGTTFTIILCDQLARQQDDTQVPLPDSAAAHQRMVALPADVSCGNLVCFNLAHCTSVNATTLTRTVF